MKKACFVVGLIGGILGMLSNAYLLITVLNMKVTGMSGNIVLGVSILGLLLSILALVGVCIESKIKTLSGMLIYLGAIANIPSSLFSITVDNPITVILCAIVAISLLIVGKMKLSLESN